MKIKAVFYNFFIILLSALFLTGCINRPKEQPDAKEAFLTAYFTMDNNGRYSRLQETGLTEESIKKYYQEFEGLTTEEFLSALGANREPYAYDEYAVKNGIEAEPKAISFEPYGDEKYVYSYVVILEVTQDGKTQETKAVGQITVEERDGRQLVSHLYISPSSKFLGSVE